MWFTPRTRLMLVLFIHLRNSEYRARDEGAEFDKPEAAIALGVQSMATDGIG